MTQHESAPSWDAMFSQLDAIKTATGKLEVPKEKRDPSLEAWIQDQRRQYKLLREKSPNENPCDEAPVQKDSDENSLPHLLTLERILKLKQIGFSWDMSHDTEWKKRYEELRAYNTSHGHCMVPARCQQHPELGRWVMTQRRQSVLLKEGKPSRMTKERQRLLEKIGFVWVLRENYQQGWQRRMQDLKEFHEEHGHYDVPHYYRSNMDLGSWVRNLRIQYLRFIQGKRCTLLTKSRFADLNKIGFNWRAKSTNSTDEKQKTDSSAEDECLDAVSSNKSDGSMAREDARSEHVDDKKDGQRLEKQYSPPPSQSTRVPPAATGAPPFCIRVLLPSHREGLGGHTPPEPYVARVLGVYPPSSEHSRPVLTLPRPHHQAYPPYAGLSSRLMAPSLYHRPMWAQPIDVHNSRLLPHHPHHLRQPSMIQCYYLPGQYDSKRSNLLRRVDADRAPSPPH